MLPEKSSQKDKENTVKPHTGDKGAEAENLAILKDLAAQLSSGGQGEMSNTGKKRVPRIPKTTHSDRDGVSLATQSYKRAEWMGRGIWSVLWPCDDEGHGVLKIPTVV